MLGVLLLILLLLVVISTVAAVGPLAGTTFGRFWRSPSVRLLVAGLGIVAGMGLVLAGLRGGGFFDLALGVVALVLFGRDALKAAR